MSTEAENAEIWDVEGNRYIDFAAGIAVVNTGHRHPKVIEAVKAQLDRFTHTCHQVVPYENYVRLAERLNAAVPGDFEKKTIFVTTGAEAVENAVKIARAATGRPAIIAFSGGFHGRTFMGMALTGKVVPYKAGFGADDGRRLSRALPGRAARHAPPAQALGALDQLFKADRRSGRVAAIIIEPVQGEGGFYPAPADFMAALRELCDQHGIAADRRRGADRLRPHRQAVRHGALRRRRRHHHDGQGPRRRLSARRRHRPRRDHGCARPRRPRRHLWRQPARHRRGACRARRDRGGAALRPRQRARRPAEAAARGHPRPRSPKSPTSAGPAS